jgi:putative transposon-encoded protein
MDTREIREGIQEQGVEEEIVYTLTTTPWGTSPGTIVPKVYTVDESVTPPTYTDVTATVMPSGSASASGDVITLPKVKSMTVDLLYRVEIKFTCSGNVFEPYAYIRCRR